MIPQSTLEGFFSEMEKIAGFKQNIGNRIVHSSKKTTNLLSSGWNDYGGWKGEGMNLKGKGRAGRAFERVTSLGGLTKHLPVGNKSLIVGGGLVDLNDARKKEDPSGRGRSRLERLSGVVGGTAAGIAASPLGLGAIPVAIGGGMVGGAIGRRLSPRKKPKPLSSPATPTPVMPNQGEAPASRPNS
jgi:hypothetical protein